MAAPLPPDMESETSRRSRRKAGMSYGFFGFFLGTLFGVGLGAWLPRFVDSATVFIVVAAAIALYWLLARKTKNKDR